MLFTTADLPANMRLDPEDVFPRATPTPAADDKPLVGALSAPENP